MMDVTGMLDLGRLELARLPTPLEKVDYAWGKHRLFVKRDDLTGTVLSGNKVRKLEYLLADALAAECDTVITCGGVQSNHARATAIAARRLGINCMAVLTGERPTEVDGNLLLGRLVGADVRLFGPMSKAARAEKLEQAADEVRAAGGKPYVIPAGGSNELGALGYLRAARELAGDLKAAGVRPTVLAVPVGSGGTIAGLFLGARLFGLELRVIGATVDETPDFWRPWLAEYMGRCAARWQLDVSFAPDEIELLDAVGRGYAVSDPDEIQFIAGFARRTGLVLDPVYTGKALFALDRAIRSGRLDPGGDVVFVHTGGVFGLFPERGIFAEVLDAP